MTRFQNFSRLNMLIDNGGALSCICRGIRMELRKDTQLVSQQYGIFILLLLFFYTETPKSGASSQDSKIAM